MPPASDCGFCRLLAGDPAARLPNFVSAHPAALAVLNRRPVAPGHVTLILRAHRDQVSGFADPDLAGVGGLIGRLAGILERRHRPRRVIVLGDGKPSAHLHLHLIPEPADGPALDLGAVVADLNLNPRPNTLDDGAMARAVAELRAAGA
jgi:histidine triad (HIT) family protein